MILPRKLTPASKGPAIIKAHLAMHRIMGTRIVLGDKVRAELARREREKKGWKI